jgi:hypothetical protein
LSQIIEQTCSLAIGGPLAGWGALLGATVAVAACAWGCWLLREDSHQAGLFFVAALLIPAIHALAVRPPFLFPRYFLMAAGFTPLLIALALDRIHHIRKGGRWAYAVLVMAWIGANVSLAGPLSTVGRGQYRAALEHIARTTDTATITLSSDHNFGVRRLIDFYAPQVSPQRTFQYINGTEWPPQGPQWLILHRCTEAVTAPPAARQQIDGHTFHLDRMFDCAILSGWQWWCYRRSDVADPANSSDETVQRETNR